MDRPRAVAGFHPGADFGDIFAEAAFVARRPDDDAGVVFVLFDGPLDAVEVGRKPRRILAQQTLVAARLAAVGFEIGLVHDVEAELVAEVVEKRDIRVVAAPDRIEVTLLHKQEVAAQVFRNRGASLNGVPFVAVDAFKHDGRAVDFQKAILDFDFAKSDPHRDELSGTNLQHQGV